MQSAFLDANILVPQYLSAGVETSESTSGETTTTAVDTVTEATSTAEETPSSNEGESSATSTSPTSTTPTNTAATSSTDERSDVSSSTETTDAGVTSGPESTAPPECPADTTYDETVELCVYDCGDGVRSPDGRCYWIGSTDMRMPWSEVPAVCTERGAGWNVLSVRSEAEHTFLIGRLEADTWLGASDATINDRWVWLDDDTAFWQGQENGQAINGQFEIWANNEPSAANDEQCARYHGSGTNWTWSDCSCGPDSGGGRGGGNWGGPGDDATDVYLPACKGPAPVEAL